MIDNQNSKMTPAGEKTEREQVAEGTRNNATGEIVRDIISSRVAPEEAPVTIKKPRGFAAISPERRREISSRGGKAAHALGVAHSFDSAEGQAAGRKGGSAPHVNRGRKPTAGA